MRLVFHRGTLLFEADPTPRWVSELPGVLWDPRVRRWRAPAYRSADIVAALQDRGVVAVVPERPDSRTLCDMRDGGLRPYQDAALVAWELAGRRGVIVLPTGAGKTRVGLAAIARLRARALVLVPTRVLLDQWVARAGEAGCDRPGRFGDGHHDLRPLTIATYESAWRWMDRIGDAFDLLVVDEAHHFGRGGRDEALEMATAPARLGLTATPPDSAGEVGLRELVGPVVFRLGISDLAGSYLAPFDLMTMTLELTARERALYDARMQTFRQVHRAFSRVCPAAAWVDFVRSVSRSQDGREALRALRDARGMLAWPHAKRRVVASLLHQHRDVRTLVFTTDNQTAYAIARTHLVMPITCDISRDERDKALGRFRDGTLRCLVSSRVLNEGVDVPDAQVGVVVGGAHGQREHVQRVGRLLRPAPDKKRATIYELVMAHTSEVFKAEHRGRALAPRSAAAL